LGANHKFGVTGAGRMEPGILTEYNLTKCLSVNTITPFGTAD
jgi:hypothetical protein